jgi:hypothetical protein
VGWFYNYLKSRSALVVTLYVYIYIYIPTFLLKNTVSPTRRLQYSARENLKFFVPYKLFFLCPSVFKVLLFNKSNNIHLFLHNLWLYIFRTCRMFTQIIVRKRVSNIFTTRKIIYFTLSWKVSFRWTLYRSVKAMCILLHATDLIKSSTYFPPIPFLRIVICTVALTL